MASEPSSRALSRLHVLFPFLDRTPDKPPPVFELEASSAGDIETGAMLSPPVILHSSDSPPLALHDKYVIVYDFAQVDHEKAEKELTELMDDLESAGLQTEVRPGYEQTLLIFVKAPRELLGNAVYKARVKDWLYGIVQTHPGGNKNTVVDNAFEAENILSVYHLINWPKSLGGAGITPGAGQWENVKSVFPLHNDAANQALLKHLSRRLILTNADLDRIRDLFGAKTAFYFAFIQTYLVFLVFPAFAGVVAWLLRSKYSLTYGIVTCIWCTVFLEYWKIQQVDLSIRWNVRNISSTKVTRSEFKWETQTVDEVTGQTQLHFPRWKQGLRQLLQIPFVILAALALGFIIAGVFALEVLIAEVYTGSYKSIVEFLPTILLALALPRIAERLEGVAEAITDFENHRIADSHEMSLTQKKFILSIITNYLPILITAFIYVPFGEDIVPWLSLQIRSMLGSYGSNFIKVEDLNSNNGEGLLDIDSGRLRDEVIALALTGQVASFFEENIMPFGKRKVSQWWRDYRTSRSKDTTLMYMADDDPAEAKLLQSARHQSTLEPYNVQDDIAEIVLQFGYLALFSPVWPLISIGFLINNIVELRTDFLKITTEHQRPAPVRSEGIGPWITSLDILTSAGSITTGAIVHLFGTNSIAGGAWWALPITIFISEHVFIAFRAIVRSFLERVGSEQTRKERHERYASRVRHLEEIEANKRAGTNLTVAERDRRKSMRATDADLFFTKQIEEGMSAQAARKLIRMCAPSRADDDPDQLKKD